MSLELLCNKQNNNDVSHMYNKRNKKSRHKHFWFDGKICRDTLLFTIFFAVVFPDINSFVTLCDIAVVSFFGNFDKIIGIDDGDDESGVGGDDDDNNGDDEDEDNDVVDNNDVDPDDDDDDDDDVDNDNDDDDDDGGVDGDTEGYTAVLINGCKKLEIVWCMGTV
mgnify:CR=1 FL=1